MATIQKLRNKKGKTSYGVLIRKAGFKPVSKTKLAEAYA